MDQLHLLWEYQEAELAVTHLETQIKRSPNRQRLVSCRDMMAQLQQDVKKIDETLNVMLDRMRALSDAIDRMDEQLKTLQDEIAKSESSDPQQLKQYIQEAEKCRASIRSYEEEIKRISRDAADREQNKYDCKARYARAKSDFEQIKKVYEPEYNEKSAERDRLKAIVNEKAAAVAPAVLEQYKTARKNANPAMAKITEHKCHGCGAEIDSATEAQVASGAICECATCKRILII